MRSPVVIALIPLASLSTAFADSPQGQEADGALAPPATAVSPTDPVPETSAPDEAPKKSTAPRARPSRRPVSPAPLTQAIEVTATQVARPVDESPVPVLVLQKTDLETSGSIDLAQAVGFAPGVTLEVTQNSARGGGPGVEIMGLSGKQVLVLLNGRPFVGDSDGVVDLSSIPTSMLERIEVVAGPMAVMYGGGAIGGVINLITRTADPASGGPFMATQARYSTYNTFETAQSLAYGASTMSAMLVGSYSSSDGFDLDPQFSDTDGERYRRSHLFASLHWNPTPELSVQVDALGSTSDRLRVYLDATGYDLYGQYFFYDWTWNESRYFVNTSLEWNRPTFSLSALVSASGYDRFYTSKVQGGFKATLRDTTLKDLNARLQARWVPRKDFFTLAGLEFRSQSLGIEATYVDADGISTAVPEVSGSTLTLTEAFLLADKTFWEGRVELYGGIRLNSSSALVISQGETTRPNYGLYPPAVLNLKWRVLDPLVLRANMGLGYRTPNLKELSYEFDHSAYNYIIRGNPNLKPEYSLNGNFSAELESDALGMIRAGYFYNDVINLIDFVSMGYESLEDGSVVQVFQTTNVHKALTQGAEFIASTKVSDVKLTAAWQYLDARDKSTGLHLLYRSPHRLKLNSTWALGDSGLELAGSARYQSIQFVSDGSDGSTQSGVGDGSTCLEPYMDSLTAGAGWNTAAIQAAESECFISSVPFWVVDARVNARFQVPGRPLVLSFFAGINNLLNVVREPAPLTTSNTSANQSLDVRPMPGRTFFVGVRGDI